jgi:uncharacterized protein YdhG (YjbR/CyaY superfamily)
MAKTKPTSIDEYIAGFPKETADKLEQIRQTILNIAPDLKESISYDIPTFNKNGKHLIYFAGWKKHIALYPITGAVAEELKEELAGYKGSKGSVHFPLDKPIPLDFVKRIVEIKLKG